MTDLIALTRTMNLYYHHLHNISSGISFSGDHELMSEFYTQMDDSYDSLIERHIGLGNSMSKSDFLSIITEAHSVLDQIPEADDMKTHFHYSLSLESSLRSQLEESSESASFGTQNLLQTLADESEMRTYKLKQRVK